MGFNQQNSRLAFSKFTRQIDKMAGRPAPDSVHRFRTSGRRVETLLQALVPHPSRNDQKLLKLLSRMRKKAGKVRDLDVQIATLRNLRLPAEARRKAQLIQDLIEERGRREKKLADALDKDTLAVLRRRLKRAAHDKIPAATDPLAVALNVLAELARERSPLTEKTLHRYRVAGKRARYLAELGGDDPVAKQTVVILKHMQDVLGDWHDWLKLTEKAEKLYGGVQDSSLVAALRNVTQAKFRQAIDVLSSTRTALEGRKAAAPAPRKPKAAAATSAVA
jgi:CHAD domain-containing protein